VNDCNVLRFLIELFRVLIFAPLCIKTKWKD